jgi:hypothetical protein
LVDDTATPGDALNVLRSLQAPVGLSPEKELALAQQLALGTPVGGGFISTLWGKVSLVSVLVGLAGGVPWALSSRAAGPASPRLVEKSAPLRATPSPAPVVVSTPASVASAPLRREPPVSTTRSTSPVPAASGRKASRDTLAEEEALLERARRLSSTAPQEARALLQQHAKRYPNGQLTAERLYLSAEVAKRLGDSAAAAEQSRALKQRFPESMYAGRVAGSQPNAP